jgi:dipeptidyl aminopeptidase/acylaminoacyl peptidase
MRRALIWLVMVLTFSSPGITARTASRDGEIVLQEPCVSKPIESYQQYVQSFQASYSEEVAAAKAEGFEMNALTNPERLLPSPVDFARMKAYRGFECTQIKYLSDGLQIMAFIWKPKDIKGKQLPLIIFNRGGNREFGKVRSSPTPLWSPWDEFGFFKFVSNGFVVIASQYRGNDGGKGKEEFGGSDVHDVLNLVPLARNLSYVDPKNIFLFGVSRGGMMTYLALKEGINVKAAAVIGGLSDLLVSANDRPDMLKEVYMELIPGLTPQNETPLLDRSAVYWPERLNVPLLILHGGADWRANPSTQALPLASKLQALKKPYELIIYAGDNHGLTLNREDSDRRIIQWFKQHMDRQPTTAAQHRLVTLLDFGRLSKTDTPSAISGAGHLLAGTVLGPGGDPQCEWPP